jgi:hypothetical protein
MAESPLKVVVDNDDTNVHVDPETGTVIERQDDGGALVHLDERRPGVDKDDDEWFKNLADDMDGVQLGVIANDLFSAIEADNKSRDEALETRARGFDLLGIKLEKPSSSIAEGEVPGMSRVTNPMMLEAILKGWANSQAELLPASGPCKIKDDGNETKAEDDLAEALERGMNHYMTVTAKEYYPDTSHMLLWGTYYGGSGFKKIYRCPMKRRPTSESVDMKDLIVSDTTKDFASCSRITHQIPMRPSVMKRMKLLKVYREVTQTQPNPQPSVVDEKIANIQGTEARPSRPEDQPYTIWECQCELDIPEYAPGKFKNEGIPIPYLVTMDKDSRDILSITRDWEEEDEECCRMEMYVKYPYVPGPGFYGTGMLGILGNSSAAMTAAWREALDAGMYASFPAGLIAKLGGRQNTNTFRLSPGQYEPVETNGMPIDHIVAPMPYRDVTPGLMAMIDKITEQSRALGASAEVSSGEGLQNIPVGTMLAQIEQATKVMAAAHKGMHTAQGEEIRLLVKLFRRNPEDFWINNKECPKDYWDEVKLMQALDNCELVPVSDPNIPSHIHRVAKALGLVQLSAMPQFAPRLDPDEVLRRVLAAMREDPIGLVVQAPPQQTSPEDQAKLLTAQAKIQDVNVKQGKLQADAQGDQSKDTLKQIELATQAKIKDADITKELIIHQADQAKIASAERRDNVALAVKTHMDQSAHNLETQKQGLELVKQGVASQQEDRTHVAGLQQHAQEHGLAQQQHGLDRLQSDRDHGLALAEHAREAQKDAADIAIETHKALHPPKPAPKARAMGGAVMADGPIAGLAGDGYVLPPIDYSSRSLEKIISPLTQAMLDLGSNMRNQQEALTNMARAAAAPRRLTRDKEGNASGVETIMPTDDPPPLDVVVDKN